MRNVSRILFPNCVIIGNDNWENPDFVDQSTVIFLWKFKNTVMTLEQVSFV